MGRGREVPREAGVVRREAKEGSVTEANQAGIRRLQSR
jgi:hypothetical protein